MQSRELEFWKARTFRLLLSSKLSSQKPKLNQDLERKVEDLLEAIYDLRRKEVSKSDLRDDLRGIFSEALHFSLLLQSQRADVVAEDLPKENNTFDPNTMEEIGIGIEIPNVEKTVQIAAFPSLIKRKDTACFEPICLFKAQVICQTKSGGAGLLSRKDPKNSSNETTSKQQDDGQDSITESQ